MKGFPLNASARADHVAVVDGVRRRSFGELHGRASRLATALEERGLAEGGRLGVMLPNRIEMVEALAASAVVGAAYLAVNWHLRPDELAWIVEDSDVRVLVADADLRATVEAAVAGHDVTVLWVGDPSTGDDPDAGADGYEAALAAADGPVRPYRWPSAWPVIYTSGTSGRPKGVVHGGAAVPEIMEMAQDGLAAMWGYGPDDVHLVAGPMYHAGPAGYAGSTLYVGGTVVLMGPWDAAAFLRLVAEHGVTTTFLTPAHFIRLLELPSEVWQRHDLSSLRHVLHGGAPCPPSVKAALIDALPGAEVWELYGASEGGASRVGPEEWRARPGTVGRPWPGVEVHVLHPDTHQEQPAGVDGIVWVRPAHGRFEYHRDPDKTADAWRDGMFSVGDVGHLDADGYLFLTDRRSDMIIRAGVNLYPREVEDVLHRHPAVVDCAVFGAPHDRDGEQPVAVVETRSPVGEDELAAWCAEHLDPYKVPVRFELVDELPRDPNGKVRKRELRDRAWDGTGRRI